MKQLTVTFIWICLISTGCAEVEVEKGNDDSDTEMTCECSTGDCCDGCDFLPSTTQCDTAPLSYQYQCSSGDCGADAQRRGIFRYCSGVDPDCPEDNYQLSDWETTEDCSADQTCVVEGESSYCHSCSEGCTGGTCNEPQCTAGECCDGVHHQPSTFQCSTTPESVEYGCTNVDCGGDAQNREQHRFCTGNSAECTTDNLQWSDWQTLDTCETDEMCDYDESDAWCNACIEGCEDGFCCVCSSGACCDGCDFRPATFQCDSTPVSTEYQCTDSSCGADLERRRQYKYCDGSSASCGTSNLQWETWSTHQDCSDDQPCNAGSATCDTCTNGCQDGACCECSTGACCDGCHFRLAAFQCDATPVSTEYQCTGTACGDDLERRRQYKYCTGSSATCGSTNLQWETWSTFQDCSTNAVCEADGASGQCTTCSADCFQGYCGHYYLEPQRFQWDDWRYWKYTDLGAEDACNYYGHGCGFILYTWGPNGGPGCLNPQACGGDVWANNCNDGHISELLCN